MGKILNGHPNCGQFTQKTPKETGALAAPLPPDWEARYTMAHVLQNCYFQSRCSSQAVTTRRHNFQGGCGGGAGVPISPLPHPRGTTSGRTCERLPSGIRGASLSGKSGTARALEVWVLRPWCLAHKYCCVGCAGRQLFVISGNNINWHLVRVQF